MKFMIIAYARKRFTSHWYITPSESTWYDSNSLPLLAQPAELSLIKNISSFQAFCWSLGISCHHIYTTSTFLRCQSKPEHTSERASTHMWNFVWNWSDEHNSFFRHINLVVSVIFPTHREEEEEKYVAGRDGRIHIFRTREIKKIYT